MLCTLLTKCRTDKRILNLKRKTTENSHYIDLVTQREMLNVGPFRWFLVVPLPSVVRTRLSWYYNNSLEMDTLVLLSKLLVLLSKIFSTGGFALTSTDKPLNIIFSFFSVVAASSPWLHLIRTANIADLFVFSLFSLIPCQG